MDILNDTCNQENGPALINRNKTVANWKRTSKNKSVRTNMHKVRWRKGWKRVKRNATKTKRRTRNLSYHISGLNPDTRSDDIDGWWWLWWRLRLEWQRQPWQRNEAKEIKKNWCKRDAYKSLRKKLISFPFEFASIANVFNNDGVCVCVRELRAFIYMGITLILSIQCGNTHTHTHTHLAHSHRPPSHSVLRVRWAHLRFGCWSTYSWWPAVFNISCLS